MGTNKFLSLATGANANVITDDTYALASYLAQGFQSGRVRSYDANKVFRQTTTIAALIGQFITDYAGTDANDSQSLAVLEGNFLAALNAVIGTNLASNINLLRAIQAQVGNFAVDAGDLGANKLHVVFPPYTPTTIGNGTPIRLQKSASTGANTGAVQVQVDSGTGGGFVSRTYTVIYPDGSNFANGDWPSGANLEGMVIGGYIVVGEIAGPTVWARRADVSTIATTVYMTRPAVTTVHIDPVNGNDAYDGTTPQTPKQSVGNAIDAMGPNNLQILLYGDWVFQKFHNVYGQLVINGVAVSTGAAAGYTPSQRRISFIGTATNSPTLTGVISPSGLWLQGPGIRTANIDFQVPVIPANQSLNSCITAFTEQTASIGLSTINADAGSTGQLFGTQGGKLNVIANAVTYGANAPGHLFVGIGAGMNPNSSNGIPYQTNIATG